MTLTRALKAAGALAITAAIGIAAPASAGTKTYAGDTDGGGKFAVDAKVKKGSVKKILAARAVDLSGTCEMSGPQKLDVATPEPIKVRSNGKFDYEFVQPEYGNVTTLKGRFKGANVKGTLNLDLHYSATDTLPEEDCTAGPVKFSGKRGAKDET